ncbi:MAG: DUF4386 domain-containing protein [Gemmatimonadota bacterium]|nr:DUF4386 domain-containing protein [Gemmatimonadota bacterium]
MDSRKRPARIAGALYLLMGFTGVFSLLYIPGKFVVRGDAAGTAAKVAANETLFRFGLAVDLLGQIAFVVLVILLYQLLKEVNRKQALMMLALFAISAPLSFFNTVMLSSPLILVHPPEVTAAGNPALLAPFVVGAMRLRNFGINAVTLLWGLWLLPFGLLVYKSRFLPKLLGVLIVIGCFGNLVVGLTGLIFPAYLSAVDSLLMLPNGIGEVSAMFWLLIKGAKNDDELSLSPTHGTTA